jgi:superfamily II DNA helicase RecQ
MSQQLILLTSPPASGKTYWISGFHASLREQSLLVISPLRALADECREKWNGTITVMTPEEWMYKKVYADVVIFDEFHLYFYWGDSFRPLMWEVFYELSIHARLCVLLTATLSVEMKSEVEKFSTQFDSLLWIDLGNQKLKFSPEMYIKAPSKHWMMRMLEDEEPASSVKLIFCQYREEVFALEKRLSRAGYNCLTCVGGESQFMKDKLRLNPTPDYIISTTVLSHGVNLPDIRKIFFLYEVGNRDFWIQMVARGGRRGESFEVFSLEKPWSLSFRPGKNLMWVIWFTLRMEFSLRSLRLS